MRVLAPLAILAATLAALFLTPPERPLLGFSHDDFGRAALGVAMLSYMIMSGVARAGGAGAARVFGGVVTWAALALLLVGLYAYRVEFAEIAHRVGEELDPSATRVGPGGEVVVRRRGQEFIVPGKVNGRAVPFVFDTGASAVVLTSEDAAAAGLRFEAADFQVPVTTANGAAMAAPARLDSVSVGPIVARGVRALVARPGALRQSLLGMTFLERLKSFTVEGGRLILKGS